MSLILEIFGDRKVSLSREISKKYESVYRGSVSELLSTLDNIKGEFVIIVSGCDVKKISNSDINIVERVNYYINNGLSSMDAIKLVAKENNLKKSDVYSKYHGGDK